MVWIGYRNRTGGRAQKELIFDKHIGHAPLNRIQPRDLVVGAVRLTTHDGT